MNAMWQHGIQSEQECQCSQSFEICKMHIEQNRINRLSMGVHSEFGFALCAFYNSQNSGSIGIPALNGCHVATWHSEF